MDEMEKALDNSLLFLDSIKMGARNSAGDQKIIQAIHDLSGELGAHNPNTKTTHSEKAIRIHEHSVRLGANCVKDESKSDDVLVAMGGEVKALPDGKVAGYLVTFSDEQSPDLAGDFFTKETDFGVHRQSPTLYNHGMDVKVGSKIIGNASLVIDEIGVWIEAQLEIADRYAKAIYELAKKGKLGWSSGTASHLVQREKKGAAWRIMSWPLGLDASLTPSPAEPRNVAFSLKSIQQTDIETQIEPEVAEATAQNTTTVTDAEKGNTNMDEKEKNDETKTAPEITDIQQGLAEILEQKKADRVAAQKREENKKNITNTLAEMVDEAMKAAPVSNDGGPALLLKTGRGDNENKAFWHWMRTGDKGAYKATVYLGEGDDEQGGAVVPNAFYSQIIQRRAEASIIRRAPASIITVSNKTVNIPVEGATAETAPASTNESYDATAVSADQNQVEPVDTKSITLVKYTRLHRLSDELLSDAQADITGFLAARVGRAFGVYENTLSFTYNTATSATYGSTKGKDAAAATSVAVGDVIGLYGSLLTEYLDQAVWVMAPATYTAILSLQGDPFSFMATPAGTAGNPTIMGRPVYTTASMQAIAATAKSVLFGNLNAGFMVAESSPMTVRRLNERFADTGQVGFLFAQRIGTVVTNAAAIQHLLHPAS
jgi:HK97 family phage major capsid protein